jgi:hypothetical protein
MPSLTAVQRVQIDQILGSNEQTTKAFVTQRLDSEVGSSRRDHQEPEWRRSARRSDPTAALTALSLAKKKFFAQVTGFKEIQSALVN